MIVCRRAPVEEYTFTVYEDAFATDGHVAVSEAGVLAVAMTVGAFPAMTPSCAALIVNVASLA